MERPDAGAAAQWLAFVVAGLGAAGLLGLRAPVGLLLRAAVVLGLFGTQVDIASNPDAAGTWLAIAFMAAVLVWLFHAEDRLEAQRNQQEIGQLLQRLSADVAALAAGLSASEAGRDSQGNRDDGGPPDGPPDGRGLRLGVVWTAAFGLGWLAARSSRRR